MYNIKILFLIIICFATACNGSNTEEKDYITIPVNLKENSLNLSMLFDSIKPIYLETNELSLVGNNPKIFFTESIILVRSHNKIDFFDFEGKFLRSINKKGNGYGEYIAIDDFYINEEIQRIEILDKKQKKILYYNYNGEYLDNLLLGFWGLKIIRDSQNYLYVYSGYERDGDNIYQFNVFDEKGRHSFHETDKKKSKFLHISNPINFHKNNEGDILFFEPFNDTIYTLHNLKIEPKYMISYNGQNVSESFYTNNNFSNISEFFQEYNKYNYVNSTYNVIESENKLLFRCRKGSDKFFNLYDKTNKTTQSYNRIVDDLFSDGLELPFQSEDFIFYENNNTLMFIIQPSWLIENKDKIVSSKLNSIMQGLNEEDNPILMVGRLK